MKFTFDSQAQARRAYQSNLRAENTHLTFGENSFDFILFILFEKNQYWIPLLFSFFLIELYSQKNAFFKLTFELKSNQN